MTTRSEDKDSRLDEKNLDARYFANKAQKAIDEMWDQGLINSDTIEQWGKEHM